VDKSLKAVLDRIEKIDENPTTRKKEAASVVTIAALVEALQGPIMAEFNKQRAEQGVSMPQRFVEQQVANTQFRNYNAVGGSLVTFSQQNARVDLAVEARDQKTVSNHEKTLRPLLPLLLPAFKAALNLEVTVGTPQQRPGVQGEGNPGGLTPGGLTPGTLTPTTPMVPMTPLAGLPGSPGSPGGNPNEQPAKSEGTVTLSAEEQLLIVSVDLQLNGEAYDVLFPFVRETLTGIKAASDLCATKPRYFELARALQSYAEANNGKFPPGAMPRPLSSDSGLPWRPDQRLSWAVALLPHLGEDYKTWKVDLDKGWHDDSFDIDPATPLFKSIPEGFRHSKNELVSTRIVAPLLAHRLPGLSPPHVAYPGRHSVVELMFQPAVTHWVAVSGVGLDAAEYAAGNAATAKKAGLFGYDRVTSKADVKDGLDKTIAFLLVPPEHKAPWMAGGGATLRAVPDESEDVRPLAQFVCITYPGKSEDKKWEGKRGTLAIMADGAVRFIPADLPPATFRALCTIAGREALPKLDTICPLIEEEKDGSELRTDAPAVNDAGRAAPAPAAPAPPPAAPAPGNAKAGVEFTPKSGAFTARFPATPQEVQQKVQAPGGPMDLTVYIAQYGTTGAACTVIYQDLPAGTRGNTDVIFNNGRDGMVSSMGAGAKVTEEKKITLGSDEGREWTVSIPGKGTAKARMYLSGTRLFFAGSGPSPAIPEAEALAFLNSFRVGK